MRTLAQRLGSGTATLYRNFESRAGLVAALVDHILGEAVLEAGDLGGMPWDVACRKNAHSVFKVLRRHPNVAPLMVDYVPIGPNATALREAAFTALLNDGFPRHIAARSFATVARYVLGFAIQASGRSARGPAPPRAAVFQGLDRKRLPATISVAGSLPLSVEEEFSFGLELIIAGLTRARRLARKDGSAKQR